MARPTTIRDNGGEIIFKNVPKERIEEIKELLAGMVTTAENALGMSLPARTQLLENVLEATKNLDDYPLDKKAFSICQNSSGSWQLVELEYNLETREAVVTDVKDVGKFRDVAQGEFRVTVAKKLF